MDREEIEAGKTSRGGWTRAQLAEWGVPWPPPRGWKHKLILQGKNSEGIHMSGAGDVNPSRLGSGTAINPDDCLHCFCQQDSGGNLKCCKCGSILIVEEIT